MELRPYQQRAINKVEGLWRTFRRLLLVAATGAGKTIMFSFLAQLWVARGKRVLILVHREELLNQAANKLFKATGLVAAIEKAERHAAPDAKVVVAMVQSIAGRLAKYQEYPFDLIICDEAHLSTTKQWQKVLTAFPNAYILGVTATPQREDQKQLGNFYESVADEIGLFELIGGGYLVPLKVRTFPLKIDVSKVSDDTAGDLDKEELAEVMGPFYRQIADAIKEYAPGRQTLTFHPLVRSSERFTAVCQEVGITARHVDGESADREGILGAFASRQFQALNNPCLLSVGYDEPAVSCILNLRPTKSRIFYTQMVGRGTRLDPGKKEDCLILDPLWQFNRMGRGLVTPAHLIGGDEEEVQELTKRLKKDGEIDLSNTTFLMQMEKDAMLAKRLLKASGWNGKYFDVAAWAAKHHCREVVDYQPTMRWQREGPTQLMFRVVMEAGFDPYDVKDRGHGAALVNFIEARRRQGFATFKQLRALVEIGLTEGLDKLTYREAEDMILADRQRKKAA